MPETETTDPDKATRKNWLQRLQSRWGLRNIWQVVLVLIVFACTGTTVLFVKQPMFDLFGMNELSGWKKTVLYLLLMFPLYQVLLLIYAFIFGQFKFFWNFEKKMFGRMAKPFRRRKKQ